MQPACITFGLFHKLENVEMSALRPILRKPPEYLCSPCCISTTDTSAINFSACTITLSTQTPLPVVQYQQRRYANVIRRPHRPTLLPQIVVLSDGSTYTQLSTSPRGIVRSTKDVRNHPLWNPRVARLTEVEDDDAGKLRAFRERYGRVWDNRVVAEREAQEAGARAGAARAAAAGGPAMEDGETAVNGEKLGKAGDGEDDVKGPVRPRRQQVDNLMDLISGGFEQLSKGPRLGLKQKKVVDTARKPAHAAGTGADAAGKPGAKK